MFNILLIIRSFCFPVFCRTAAAYSPRLRRATSVNAHPIHTDRYARLKRTLLGAHPARRTPPDARPARSAHPARPARSARPRLAIAPPTFVPPRHAPPRVHPDTSSALRAAYPFSVRTRHVSHKKFHRNWGVFTMAKCTRKNLNF